MKKPNFKLFQKLEDKKISSNSLMHVFAGNVIATERTHCTADGRDCTDPSTQLQTDSEITNVSFDSSGPVYNPRG